METEWLVQELDKRGRGAKSDLARALGLAESAVTRMVKGERKISAKEADAIRAFLTPQPAANELVILQTADVPVLGTALGGDGDGDFFFNGHALHYVKRPAKFAGRDDIFALYASGSSMAPRYIGGELIFCERRRAPSVGDHVVVELHPAQDGTVPAYLKRFDGLTPTSVRLHQYNPPKSFDVDRRKVRQIVRVLTLGDMIG